MIAGGHDIGAGLVEFACDLVGNADAAGGVLAVDDGEIDGKSRPKARQMFLDPVPSGAADDIAEKENFHVGQPLSVTFTSSSIWNASRSVTIQSSC